MLNLPLLKHLGCVTLHHLGRKYLELKEYKEITNFEKETCTLLDIEEQIKYENKEKE